MRRPLLILLAVLSALVFGAPAAVAGSAHFINNAFEISRSGDTLTVAGKEAGLGDLAQVHIVVSATALCINNGGNHPRAVNKASFSAGDDFPVQNGKADFSLSLTATFQPECSPPMTVQFTDVKVTDTTNGISQSFPGTF
ncbi:MAG TPA: hypothetical protein VGR06_33290 [Actinophytocola sp.]|jgi:hypothetical protein|uniref:hypothetical protein n=1 Tax=Actinophytocola sp. TaxID=1872138 RepID=UPI002DFC0E14|nr:hypothetical protein [Actinophytocola sp.]